MLCLQMIVIVDSDLDVVLTFQPRRQIVKLGILQLGSLPYLSLTVSVRYAEPQLGCVVPGDNYRGGETFSKYSEL